MVIQAYDSEKKIRPGVYIKTIVVPNNNAVVTGKGAVAVGLQMDWGEESKLIECNQDQYFAGNYRKLLGYSLQDTTKLLPFTLALSNCYKAYFYRLNSNGVKASGTVGSEDDEITITAKYTGIVGNLIKVVIEADKPTTGKYMVTIFVDGTKQEKYIVSNLDGLLAISSDWVVFTAGASATTITATAGLTLTGGTNGTVAATALASFFESLTYKHIDTIAVNDATSTTQTALANWAVAQNAAGKDIQAVCISKLEDNECIISTYNQGYKVGTEYEVTPALFTILAAGARAGCPYNQSLAGRTISGATEITNPADEDVIESLLEQGYFLLTYDIDGTVCIEEDQNTLVSFSETKPEDLKYNQVFAVRAFINYQTAMVFRNYSGKFTNIDSVRKNIKSDIIKTVYDYLLDLGAIEDYDSDSDITIEKKDARSALVDEFFQVAQTLTKLFVRNHLKF